METAELASADVLLVESKVQESTCLFTEGMYNITYTGKIPLSIEKALKEREQMKVLLCTLYVKTTVVLNSNYYCSRINTINCTLYTVPSVTSRN